jgi:peptide/nickel transport system substrate-binding protein
MENRFALQDLFVILLLLVIIVMIGLAMVQYDRQWRKIQDLQKTTSGLTNDLTGIRNLLASGAVSAVPRPGPVNAVPGAGSSSVNPAPGGEQPLTGPGADPFARLKQVRAKPDFAEGDWLIDNFGTNLKKITPIVSSDVYAVWVQSRVLESLAYRDPYTLEHVPMLATDWLISPDGLTMTFNLRQGVVFSDGAPFTADDVLFTFEWIKNPAVAAARARAYFEKIESVTKEGDYRVVFKFREFYALNFSSVVEQPIIPRHFFSKYKPSEFNEAPGLLLGTGPHRLASPDGWRPGDQLVLYRNERYWGTPPAFNRIVFLEVQEEIAVETLYRNRQLDVLGAMPEQYNKLLKDKSIMDRSQSFDFFAPTGGYTYIAWNQKRGDNPTFFADQRVRQAMTLLLDRERLANEIWFGYAQPASGPFYPFGPQHNPEVKPWPYDPKKGLELLREAGFEDRNKDGVLEDPTGKPFQFTFTYSSGNALSERLALFFRDSYARAGIKLELDAVEWSQLLDKLDRRDFDAVSLGWSASVETDPYQMFHSSQMQDQGDNRMSYSSPRLDKALEVARVTVDPEERMKKWHEVHRILHEEQPYTFLLNRKGLRFIDSRIKNVETTKMGLNWVRDDLMMLPWYVPSGQQLHTN